MPADRQFEEALQALLDGRPVPHSSGRASASVLLVDAIARVHRTALFGAEQPLDCPPAARWGHLDVRAEIGRGASGTVYRAWDLRLAREVALKLFPPEAAAEDAIEEGRLLAKLNHPNIVRVFGADIHDGRAGLWMELLEGETLDHILARDGVLGVEEALLVGLDLTRALSAVHAAGLLHRDVKARNVIRERGGRLVLMDLGAGRLADVSPTEGDETGTPMYMAPEVVSGGAATARSDIHCLGVLMYRLLSRSFPVAALHIRALRQAHAVNRRVPLSAVRPDLPVEIVQVIERGCHPDPVERYASAPEFEAALAEAFRRTVSRSAIITSPIGRVWARWKRRTLTTAVVIILALGSGWAIWQTRPMRAVRRTIGLTVPARSTIYMTTNAGIGIVRGRRLELKPYNPTTAIAISVSHDHGIRTMTGTPPWTTGGSFRLDGTPIAAPPIVSAGLCCFYDGTTDGQFNYAARADSTLLDPIGSRPVAPPALYRFARDWSNPELVFPLATDGWYGGVAYAGNSASFWLTKKIPTGGVIEQWSRSGTLMSVPVRASAAFFSGIGVDPLDDTLWVLRTQSLSPLVRMVNFATDGRQLASVDLERPTLSFLTAEHAGVEFSWIPPR